MHEFIIGDVITKDDVSISHFGDEGVLISGSFSIRDISFLLSNNSIAPDVIFDEEELENWATKNGYVEEV